MANKSRVNWFWLHGIHSRIAIYSIIFAAFLRIASAELAIYQTDFDAMTTGFSLSGQEYWETSDLDKGLGFGAADGIASISTSAGQSQAGFLGGYFRHRFPPGATEVLLGPRVHVVGSTLDMSVDLVLLGSQSVGLYSADDTFGWSVRDGSGNELMRVAFEPTSSNDDRREIVIYDDTGTRLSSDLDLFVSALYRLRIKALPELGGDRFTATIDDTRGELDIGSVLLPAGSIQATTQFAAFWEMASAVVGDSGVVTGFGNNIMAFDNYSVATEASNAIYAADISVQEGAVAMLEVQLSEPLTRDLEVFYTTVDETALSVSDYRTTESVATPLIVPAGSLIASVGIPITGDSVAEAKEELKVEISGTDGGVAVLSPVVQIKIIDDDDADGDGMGDVWENQFGLDADDPADALQDTDGDGVVNLLEYAVGLDPTTSDPSDPFELHRTGALKLAYVRNLAFTNLRYLVEISDNILEWAAVPDVAISRAGDLETREAVIPTGDDRKFMRLSVQVSE